MKTAEARTLTRREWESLAEAFQLQPLDAAEAVAYARRLLDTFDENRGYRLRDIYQQNLASVLHGLRQTLSFPHFLHENPELLAALTAAALQYPSYSQRWMHGSWLLTTLESGREQLSAQARDNSQDYAAVVGALDYLRVGTRDLVPAEAFEAVRRQFRAKHGDRIDELNVAITNTLFNSLRLEQAIERHGLNDLLGPRPENLDPSASSSPESGGKEESQAKLESAARRYKDLVEGFGEVATRWAHAISAAGEEANAETGSEGNAGGKKGLDAKLRAFADLVARNKRRIKGTSGAFNSISLLTELALQEDPDSGDMYMEGHLGVGAFTDFSEAMGANYANSKPFLVLKAAKDFGAVFQLSGAAAFKAVREGNEVDAYLNSGLTITDTGKALSSADKVRPFLSPGVRVFAGPVLGVVGAGLAGAYAVVEVNRQYRASTQYQARRYGTPLGFLGGNPDIVAGMETLGFEDPAIRILTDQTDGLLQAGLSALPTFGRTAEAAGVPLDERVDFFNSIPTERLEAFAEDARRVVWTTTDHVPPFHESDARVGTVVPLLTEPFPHAYHLLDAVEETVRPESIEGLRRRLEQEGLVTRNPPSKDPLTTIVRETYEDFDPAAVSQAEIVQSVDPDAVREILVFRDALGKLGRLPDPAAVDERDERTLLDGIRGEVHRLNLPGEQAAELVHSLELPQQLGHERAMQELGALVVDTATQERAALDRRIDEARHQKVRLEHMRDLNREQLEASQRDGMADPTLVGARKRLEAQLAAEERNLAGLEQRRESSEQRTDQELLELLLRERLASPP